MASLDTTAIEQTPKPQNAKPLLLIVDDEAGPRESLRIVFKDRFNCHIATCGRDGVEYARNNSVDAAILDIKMPDLSGVDVLRELKEIDPNIECIMLTGYETIETARQAVRFGAADYLNKPFDVFVVRDVLERCMARRRGRLSTQQNLEALRENNEQLSREVAQINRAVAAGVLSAGVVHEMNNPLAIIAAYTELLGRDLSTLNLVDQNAAQHAQQRLASIQREISRCKDIARRLLNFSRAEKGSEEIIEVNKLLEDSAALIKAHPANKSAELLVSSTDESLRLLVHPAEVLQVLINLGINSLQAMDGRGTLKISAVAAGTPPTQCAFRPDSFDAKRPLVRISVADTGCGIPPELLPKVFQPYFTSKKEGTGLGLAIVCELVSHQGGLIDVSSTVGEGTTFSVYLPLAS